MNNKQTRREFGATALAAIAASAMPAPYVRAAEKKYDPGASDTEIKLGQTMPHSGPGSLYGVLGRVGEAYFQMLNEKRRHQRPQDQVPHPGRRLQRAEMRRGDAAAGRAGGSAGAVRLARHRAADRRA